MRGANVLFFKQIVSRPAFFGQALGSCLLVSNVATPVPMANIHIHIIPKLRCTRGRSITFRWPLHRKNPTEDIRFGFKSRPLPSERDQQKTWQNIVGSASFWTPVLMPPHLAWTHVNPPMFRLRSGNLDQVLPVCLLHKS